MRQIYIAKNFKPQPNSLHATSLRTRLTELLLTRCLLCPDLLQFNTNSLTNVLEAEGLRCRLLENSIATACIFTFSYLSVPFTLRLVVICLLGTSQRYLSVQLLVYLCNKFLQLLLKLLFTVFNDKCYQVVSICVIITIFP